MAKVVLGIGTSHGPQLALPPEHWWRRRDWDRQFPELWYQGREITFEQLADERAGEHLDKELSEETFRTRFDACQKAIGSLNQVWEHVKPDVAIIIGDDQHECFLEDNMPSISLYWGDTVDSVPLSRDSGEFAMAPPELSRFPQVRTSNPCNAALGQHVIGHLIKSGFDPAHSRALPAGRHGEHGIGHAFSYVYRRLMNDRVVPHVPIFLNTYYPPNQPTLARCYQLGRELRKAVQSWDSDQTVALIASGGMTHFVIEEDLDRQVLDALEAKDEATLVGFPAELFNSGNSEMRNWMTVAGAMHESNMGMRLIDYVPCYRSEAGTGCAMAFAHWQ